MYSAALDLSGNRFLFALMNDGRVLKNIIEPMSGRDSSALAVRVIDALKAESVEVDDVGEWTVGSGPGSFTGLRLAAAFVGGLTLGKANVKLRAVPGAVALAAAAGKKHPEAKEMLCLYDGRNKEVLAFGLKKTDGEWTPNGISAVLNAEQAREFFQKLAKETALAALNDDLNAIAKVLPEEWNDQISGEENPDPTAMILAKKFPFDGDLTHPVYLRPAVFS